MILFLFIILIGGIIVLYLYFDNKVMTLKRQLITLTSQYNKLKESCNTSFSSKTVSIKFENPTINCASLKSNIKIYFAPSTESPILKTSTETAEVQILDSASIDSLNWFYICLPNCSINNKGWVLENDLFLN